MVFIVYEETNPPDIEESVVKAVVESCFPEIHNPKIKFYYHGTYNVYIVENRYLFRFPSTILPLDERQRLVRQESLLLVNLRKHLTFEIPYPEFVEFETNTPFMGYQMIQGESLSRHFQSTTSTEQQPLGRQVGKFLSELHAIDERILGMGSDGIYNPKESCLEAQSMMDQVQELVFPRLSKHEIEWTEKLFHNFIDKDENFEYESVLVHGDFDTTNILINPETILVTGIIDFEETRVYDPAVDFIFLREGVEFLTNLLNSYSGDLDSQIGERVIFMLGRQPFIYILWGLKHDLVPMVDYGYSSLKEMLKYWKHYTSVANECFKRYTS